MIELLAAAAADPSAPAGGASSALVTSLISGTVVAALVAAVINVWLGRRKSLDEERSRIRAVCAEAFQVVADYKEYPYAIRRRNDAEPAAERARLSEGMRAVQGRLSYYTAWMKGESVDLGDAYSELVANVRRVAGLACHNAWKNTPAQNDEDMNIPISLVDLTELKQFEDAYISEIQKHLASLTMIKRMWLGR